MPEVYEEGFTPKTSEEILKMLPEEGELSEEAYHEMHITLSTAGRPVDPREPEKLHPSMSKEVLERLKELPNERGDFKVSGDGTVITEFHIIVDAGKRGKLPRGFSNHVDES